MTQNYRENELREHFILTMLQHQRMDLWDADQIIECVDKLVNYAVHGTSEHQEKP